MTGIGDSVGFIKVVQNYRVLITYVEHGLFFLACNAFHGVCLSAKSEVLLLVKLSWPSFGAFRGGLCISLAV